MRSIGVCSGKGSPGATFVAVNLAHAFTSHGQDVVLLDLDPQGGDIAGYLGLDPRKGLYPLSLLGRIDYSTQALLGEIEIRAGLACIAGFPKPTFFESSSLRHILTRATESQKLVIADLGRVEARSADVASDVDLVLLVVRPDLVSVHGAQRAKEILVAAGSQESQIRLVISGWEWRYAGDIAEIAEVGIPTAGMIPVVRRAARKALQTQTPILRGRAAKAFSALAKGILDKPAAETSVATEVAVA